MRTITAVGIFGSLITGLVGVWNNDLAGISDHNRSLTAQATPTNRHKRNNRPNLAANSILDQEGMFGHNASGITVVRKVVGLLRHGYGQRLQQAVP